MQVAIKGFVVVFVFLLRIKRVFVVSAHIQPLAKSSAMILELQLEQSCGTLPVKQPGLQHPTRAIVWASTNNTVRQSL
jgi:hypothetical protein